PRAQERRKVLLREDDDSGVRQALPPPMVSGRYHRCRLPYPPANHPAPPCVPCATVRAAGVSMAKATLEGPEDIGGRVGYRVETEPWGANPFNGPDGQDWNAFDGND